MQGVRGYLRGGKKIAKNTASPSLFMRCIPFSRRNFRVF
jgi:hypothetical protein